jgi:hypothetical protein
MRSGMMISGLWGFIDDRGSMIGDVLVRAPGERFGRDLRLGFWDAYGAESESGTSSRTPNFFMR